MMTQGAFIWRDLMTTDVDQAKAFYTELFGWGMHDEDMGPAGTYTMWKADEHQLGGVVALPQEEEIPSHWISYLTVEDTDASLEKVEQLGGKVCVPATDIPNVGRFAVIDDPQGGTISLMQRANEDAPISASATDPGRVCWNELVAEDPQKAQEFYGEIVGWTFQNQDMGGGPYSTFTRGDEVMEGGMFGATEQMPAPPCGWVPYFSVADVDESTRRARELGAQVIVEPRDLDQTGRMSWIQDPTGAFLALFTGIEPQEES